MKPIIYKLRLDCHKNGNQGTIIVKKGDTASRTLAISLVDNGKPYIIEEDCTAIIRAVKPDGTVLFNDTDKSDDCVISENTVHYTLTSQTISAVGDVICEITLYSATKYDKDGNAYKDQLASPRFTIVVEDNLYSDSEIESTNEYTALNTELARAEAVKGVSFQTDNTYIQWQHDGDAEWNNLVALTELSTEWRTGTVITAAGTYIIAGAKTGDIYLNTTTYNVYKAISANTWMYICNIKGLKGDTGADGYSLRADTPCLIIPTDKNGILTADYSAAVKLKLYKGSTLLTNTTINYVVINNYGYASPAVSVASDTVTYSWYADAKIKDFQMMDLSVVDLTTGYTAAYSLPVIACKRGIDSIYFSGLPDSVTVSCTKDGTPKSTAQTFTGHLMQGSVNLETGSNITSAVSDNAAVTLSCVYSSGIVLTINSSSDVPSGKTPDTATVTVTSGGIAYAKTIQIHYVSNGTIEADTSPSATSENPLSNKMTTQMFAEKTSYGVLSGYDISFEGGMNIAIGAGTAYLSDGIRVTNDGSLIMTLMPSDGVLNRTDIIYVNHNGGYSIADGTPGAGAPSLPAGGMPLYELHIAANAEAVTSADVTDKRKILYTQPDAALSATSDNSVQNKVVKSEFDAINSDITGINTILTQKANSTDMTTALALKANTTDVNTAFDTKANASETGSMYGVLTGLIISAHSTPDMSVQISAGTYYNAKNYKCNANTYPSFNISAADTSKPRIDVVYINDYIYRTASGTPAAIPNVPSVPASSVVLAEIYIAANATAITNANITDRRVFVRADDALSSTSINAVQNKAVKARFDAINTDITDINTTLEQKANTADMISALSLKAYTADVNTLLALKANNTDITNINNNISGINYDIANINASFAEKTPYGVLSGYDLSLAGGGMNVDITTGVAYCPDGTRSDYSSPSMDTLDNGDGTYPRIDIIYAYGGGYNRVTGTPAAIPVAPSVPDGGLLLYDIYIPAGTTSLSSDNVTDKRITYLPIDTIIAEKTSYGVISGIGTMAQSTPNMTVSAATGIIYMATGTRYTPTANTALAVNAADATNPRTDIVYVSSVGVISYLAGTAAASPAQPAVPTGGQLISVLNIPAGATAVTADMIADRRKMLYTDSILLAKFNDIEQRLAALES